MKSWARIGAAAVAGFVTWALIGMAGFGVLRAAWPDYALAEPKKAYSLAMLLARLLVGVICTAAAGMVATRVARDTGRVAFSLGGLLFLVSLRPHLYTVWNDYPIWYHAVYLLYLVPVAGFGGRLVREVPAHSDAATA